MILKYVILKALQRAFTPFWNTVIFLFCVYLLPSWLKTILESCPQEVARWTMWLNISSIKRPREALPQTNKIGNSAIFLRDPDFYYLALNNTEVYGFSKQI